MSIWLGVEIGFILILGVLEAYCDIKPIPMTIQLDYKAACLTKYAPKLRYSETIVDNKVIDSVIDLQCPTKLTKCKVNYL